MNFQAKPFFLKILSFFHCHHQQSSKDENKGTENGGKVKKNCEVQLFNLNLYNLIHLEMYTSHLLSLSLFLLTVSVCVYIQYYVRWVL